MGRLLHVGVAVLLAASMARAQGLPADASAMAAAVIERGSVAIDGVVFEGNTATLAPAADPVLRRLLRMLNDHDEWRFEVRWHGDGAGTPAATLALSERRASAVVAWLTNNGIAGSRLVARGYGDGRPVADNDGGAGVRRPRLELKKLNEEDDPIHDGVR